METHGCRTALQVAPPSQRPAVDFTPKQEASPPDFAPPLADFKKLIAKAPAAVDPDAPVSSTTAAFPPGDDDDYDDEELDQLLNLKKPAAANQSGTGEDEEEPVSEKGGWRTTPRAWANQISSRANH